MDKLLSGLKLDYWYHLFIALGAAGLFASLTVQTKGIANAHALLLSLGVLLIGTGEWINHPLQTTLYHPTFETPLGGQTTGHPRSNSPLGVLFVLAGLGLAGAAVYKIAQAA